MCLPPPDGLLDSTNMEVQERLYGHRFITEQEPFMIVLEALAVMAGTPLGNFLPTEDKHECFKYRLRRRRKLRFLLFQDRNLDEIADDGNIHDDQKWDQWKSAVNGQFDPGGSGQDHFAYLDSSFECSISSLRQAVRLLRSAEIDVVHNRRWTSRFLAVTGPDMILPDMRESRGKWSIDRRFFGRAGELVYLMLNRSKLSESLNSLIEDSFGQSNDPLNQVANALSDPDEDDWSRTQIGYLPHKDHHAYLRLAEDWNAILRLNRLPKSHRFEPLFRITALNLVVYLAEIARDQVFPVGSGKARPVPIMMDFMDGSEKQLRDRSKEHFDWHRKLANRAVKKFVEDHAKDTTPTKTLKVLFGVSPEDHPTTPPETQLQEGIDQAIKRDKNNIYKFLLPLTKNAGLVKARPGIGTWFCMSDKTLIALTVANADQKTELREFLEKLYVRYGIVAGPSEARKAFDRPHVGAQQFEANLAELEERMARLALVHRLSDDCAFVTNPYIGNHE